MFVLDEVKWTVEVATINLKTDVGLISSEVWEARTLGERQALEILRLWMSFLTMKSIANLFHLIRGSY